MEKVTKESNTSKQVFIQIASLIALFFLLDFGISYFLSTGIEKYYGINSKADIGMIGHSQLMLGVDNVKLEEVLGLNVAKYTREGVSVQDREMMTTQLIETNPTIKTLIYGVDSWTFTTEGLSENSYQLFYPFINSELIDDYVEKHAPTGEYLTKKIVKVSRFNDLLLNAAIRGHIRKWDNLKNGQVDTVHLKEEVERGRYRPIVFDENSKAIFERTVTHATDKGIRVILLMMPTVDIIGEDVQPEQVKKAVRFYENFEKTHKNVTYINFQEPWNSRHQLFFDHIHLNVEGQTIITNELLERLKPILKK